MALYLFCFKGACLCPERQNYSLSFCLRRWWLNKGVYWWNIHTFNKTFNQPRYTHVEKRVCKRQKHKFKSLLPIGSEMLHRDNCGKGREDSKSLKIKGLIILFNSTVQCEKFPWWMQGSRGQMSFRDVVISTNSASLKLQDRW